MTFPLSRNLLLWHLTIVEVLQVFKEVMDNQRSQKEDPAQKIKKKKMWAPEGSGMHHYCTFYGEFSKQKIFKAKILFLLQEMPNSYHACL